MNEFRNNLPQAARSAAKASGGVDLPSAIDDGGLHNPFESTGPGPMIAAPVDLLDSAAFAGSSYGASALERREAAVAIIMRHASGQGTKAIDRAMRDHWTADHVGKYGPMPKARTARRWCSIARAGRSLSTRDYTRHERSIARKTTAVPEATAEATAEACPSPHSWLPAIGECIYVDGMRITTVTAAGGPSFYRLDGGGMTGRGVEQGRMIAAEVELQRVVAAAIAPKQKEQDDDDPKVVRATTGNIDDLVAGPPWKRRRHRLFPAVAGDPAIGERVKVGDRVRRFLGRTGNGRLAFADTPVPGMVPRPTIRTFPSSVTIVRLRRSPDA